jgi:monoamine oxidase
MVTHECDVVVAGAGAAGLQAACTLAARGLSVVLVEASDRAGGRIHTAYTDAGEPVELGAEFVHGMQPVTLAWMERAGLTLIPADDRVLHLAHGQVQPLDDVYAGYSIVEMLESFVDPDMSAADWLSTLGANYSPEAIQFARRYIEGFNAADSAKISALWVGRTEAELAHAGGQNFRVPEGYERLPQFMAQAAQDAGAQLWLRHSVMQIAAAGDGVAVRVHRAADGQNIDLRARASVVALPLGVLARPGHLAALLPDRPPQLDGMIASMHAGSIYKVSLEFDRRHWPDEIGYLFTSQPDIQTWWVRPGSSIITAWFPPEPEERAPLDETRLRSRTLKALASILGTQASTLENSLRRMYFRVWHADAFTGLAYSYVGVNQLGTPARLAALNEASIFFAGEHCAPGYAQGTVHGALGSGLAAAEGVFAALGVTAG